MFDQDERLVRQDLVDEVDGPVGLLAAHPRGGFVEQEELGVGREREPELEPALVAVRERPGRHVRLVLEAGLLEHPLGARADVGEG